MKKFVLLILAVFLMQQGSVFAQQGGVTGRVIDVETGNPLPGANVLLVDLAAGAAAGIDGRYRISNVPAGTHTIQVSYIGFRQVTTTIEVVADEDVVMNFELRPDLLGLEEVVVVGYGVQERRDVTGAMSSLSSQEIQELPVTDAGQALQGRVPGVMALSAGGRPGQGVTIRIRGRRSLTASNEPLYVVDGIPFPGSINDINPRDIESIEVLKDASATAIYGARGANGVILISTMQGGDHETMVTYSGYGGITREYAVAEMMNAEQFANVRRQADITARMRLFPDDPSQWERDDAFIFNEVELGVLASGESYNWPGMVFDPGYQQSHQLSIRGGDARSRFVVSGNFFEEQGIVSTQDFTRYSLRVNFNHDATDRLRIGTSAFVSNVIESWGPNPYGYTTAITPLAAPRDAEGNLILQPGADPLLWNPLVDMEPNMNLDDRRRLRLFSNLFAEYKLTENLTYTLNFGPDFDRFERGVFQGSLSTARQSAPPAAEKELWNTYAYTFDNILNYRYSPSRMHAVNFTGLFGVQESRSELTYARGTNVPYDSQLYHNLETADIEGRMINSNLIEWGIMSYMGRVNYVLMDKYLFTVTGRFDGSSVLAEGNKWSFFPSGAIGWRIISEPFMANQTLFNDLRLRVSYGSVGNSAVNPYQTRGGLSRTTYNFGDVPAIGWRPTSIANPDLKWEVSTTLNFGLEFAILDERISGAVDIYETHTTDLLLARQLPPTSGFTQVLENIGETKNRGFEVDLSTQNIVTRDFTWTSSIAFFGNTERIVDLYGTGEDDLGNQWFIGEPLTVWYDYDMIGIWQLGEEEEAAVYGQQPGEIRVRDVNGDGVIDENDRVVLGTDMPSWNLGLTNRFRYRNLDMSIFLFGSFGHVIQNNFLNATLVGRYNQMNVDYWTPDNPSNTQPRPDRGVENPRFNTSRMFVSGDFLKIRNVQLGYRLPASVTQGIGVHSLRVYVNASNLYMWSNLEKGIDPELYGGNIGAIEPTTRMFSFGVDINF